MTLTELEYGSLASSATLNSNFQDLQTQITTLSSLITSSTSSYSSTVATLNTSVTNLLNCRNSFIPTGAIIAFQSDSIPEGFLLCDGSEVLIADYNNLFEVIGTTYGQSDSTKFAIPDLLNKTLFGLSETNSVGDYLSAGLPNITGSYCNASRWNRNFTGALYSGGTGIEGFGQNGYGNNSIVAFDASKSNSIYGNSTTVQPPALVTNFIIKY